MDDQNVAIRLKGFIDSQGLTHSQFADQCGIPRPSLSQLLSGRNKKISDVIVGQIHKTFPQLSVLWLMFGEGPMILPDTLNAATNETDNETAFPSGGLFSDDLDFVNRDTANRNISNLTALNKSPEGPKTSHYKRVEVDEKIAELQKQIDKLRKNPRKVTQITVYYDDSTFETFIPKN